MNLIVVVIAALLWLGGSSTEATAQHAQFRAGARQSMDIVINRWVVDAEGQPIGPRVGALRYHLERVKTDKGWRTNLVLDDAGRQQAGPPNPFLGGRIEFDEIGRFGMFDKDGHEVAIPPRLQPGVGLTFDDEWSAWPTAGNAETRRRTRVAEVEARYGRSTGKLRGLSRYVKQTGEDLEELLVDANSGLPVELNVVQAGVLRGQVTFDYTEQPGRGLVRRAMRSETRLNDQGDRAVTTTEFTNVSFGQEN
jgi:hypothetical protein